MENKDLQLTLVDVKSAGGTAIIPPILPTTTPETPMDAKESSKKPITSAIVDDTKESKNRAVLGKGTSPLLNSPTLGLMGNPPTALAGVPPQMLRGSGLLPAQNIPEMSSMDALTPSKIPTPYVCLNGLCTPDTYTVLTREYYMNVENEVAREVQSVLVDTGGSVLSGPYTVKGHVVVELSDVKVAAKVHQYFSGRAYKGNPIKSDYLYEAGYATLTIGLKRKSRILMKRTAEQSFGQEQTGKAEDGVSESDDSEEDRRRKKRKRKKYRKRRRRRSPSPSESGSEEGEGTRNRRSRSDSRSEDRD